MKDNSRLKNRISLWIEVVLTFAICFGIAFNSLRGLCAEAKNYGMEVIFNDAFYRMMGEPRNERQRYLGDTFL